MMYIGEKQSMKKTGVTIGLLVICSMISSCGKQSMNIRQKEEPVIIEISWWGEENRSRSTKQVCELYQKLHPNIEFKYSSTSWDGYFDKLATQAATGTMPDIIQMDYMYLKSYTQNGSLMDLTEYIEDGTIDVSGINQTFVKSGIVDEKYAGIVISETALSIGYNEELFWQAGVEEPTADWTWEDFTDKCETIASKTGKYGFMADFSTDISFFRYWVRQHGYELFSEDNRSLAYEDDQICAGYFNMWKKLMNKQAMVDAEESTAYSRLKQEKNPIVTKDVAMILEWNNFAKKMSAYTDKIKMMTPPGAVSDEKPLWLKPGMFLSISETSEVKKEAAEFINWFLNSNEANEILLGERGVPVTASVRQHLIDSSLLGTTEREMFEGLDAAEKICGEMPPPEPLGMMEVTDAFQNAGAKVYYGEVSALEAAKEFRQDAEEILQKNN